MHRSKSESIENIITHLEDHFLVNSADLQEGYLIIHKPSKGSLIIEEEDFHLEVVQAMLGAGVEIKHMDGLHTFIYGNNT